MTAEPGAVLVAWLDVLDAGERDRWEVVAARLGLTLAEFAAALEHPHPADVDVEPAANLQEPA